MPNEYIYLPAASSDFAVYIEGDPDGVYQDVFAAGYNKGPGGGPDGLVDGGLRVRNVTLARNTSVNDASLSIYVDAFYGGQVYLRVYGIAEDDTASFGDPFTRSRTSHYTDIYIDSASTGSRVGVGVKDIVNEILSRSGWNSGNAMGFVVIGQSLSNHGQQDNYISDVYGGSESCLAVTLSAPPNLTPTPVTVSAPTFPSSRGYGLKISESGVDVKTATDAQLLYTSDKDYLKILAEDQITTVASTEYLIAHGLSYVPKAMAFGRANGKSFELPRLLGGASDPVGGGLQGYISVDSTYIRILTRINATVYYYVFIDELI